MAVKKVSSELLFITEPRTDFTRAATGSEKNQTVGSFPASSIAIARKWAAPDELTAEVEVPTGWALAFLPQKGDYSVAHRARYVSSPTPLGQRRVFLIDQVDVQELDSQTVKLSIKGLSPEAWLRQVPSTIQGADQTFSGRAIEPFLAMMYESTVGGNAGRFPCTETIDEVQYRALPIVDPAQASAYSQSQLEYYGVDPEFDPTVSPSDGKETGSVTSETKDPGFPAPIGDRFFSIMQKMPYRLELSSAGVEKVEYRSEFEAVLMPVDSPFDDGCLWWAWGFHPKTEEAVWISQQAGTADSAATLHVKTGATDVIAWISASSEGSAGKAATASFPGKPLYTGPWAYVSTKEVSEGQNLTKADASREAAAEAAGLQPVITIDATANADSDTIDGIKLRPGTVAGVRFGDQAFTFPIGEVDYSFNSDDGWSIKAPVSVETTSIDYIYPWIDPAQPPAPPVTSKAGLKRVLGGGWRGSFAQDLRGAWWLLYSSGGSTTIGDPKATKIDGLASDATLLAIATKTSGGNTVLQSPAAVFVSEGKAVFVDGRVSTVSGETGDETIGTVSTTELKTDAAPVVAWAAVDQDRIDFVTALGTTYSVSPGSDPASPVLTVLTALDSAGTHLEHCPGPLSPTTFTAGAVDNTLLVANGSYAFLLERQHDSVYASISLRLDSDERVLSSPASNAILTTKRLVTGGGVLDLTAHGGLTAAWPTGGDDTAFIGAGKDGSLLFFRGSALESEVLPAFEGRTWSGIVSQSSERIFAYGSAGIFLATPDGDAWLVDYVDSSPVVSAAGIPTTALGGDQVCFVTAGGTLNTIGNVPKTVETVPFSPKRCWASLPLASQTGNASTSLKGQILIADDSRAALLTQSSLQGDYTAESISISSPVKTVVKSLYGTFFILLEDGSLIDESGDDVLAGSDADGAVVTAITTDSKTGGCWIASDRGAFRAASTRDSIFVKPGVSQPATGQVERLEGTWGEISAVAPGVTAGSEEAHFGHPAATVTLGSLTSPAVKAVPAGDKGCFILLEDGSVCLQPSASSALYEAASAPEGWKPTELTHCTGSTAIAWSADGHAEVVGPVDWLDFSSTLIPATLPVKQVPAVSSLSKLKADDQLEAWAIIGGSLSRLDAGGTSPAWETVDTTASISGVTDFVPTDDRPILRTATGWGLAVDGTFKKMAGLSGDLVSFGYGRVSTAGGTVDTRRFWRHWDAEAGEWSDDLTRPVVVSSKPMVLMEDRACIVPSGLVSLTTEDQPAPEDHTDYASTVYSTPTLDETVQSATVFKRGSSGFFWLGAEGFTDGDTHVTSPAVSAAIDASKTAALSQLSGSSLENGLLVALDDGCIGIVARDQLTRFVGLTADSMIGFFGSTSYDEATPLLAVSKTAVTAAWKGESLFQPPIVITSTPAGIEGEVTSALLWGRYGAQPLVSTVLGGTAAWPAAEGLGGIESCRSMRGRDTAMLVAFCEHGVFIGSSYGNTIIKEHLTPIAGGLGFTHSSDTDRMIVSTTDNNKIVGLIPTRESSAQVIAVKTSVDKAAVAEERAKSLEVHIAATEGIKKLTFSSENGSWSADTVSGSLPATAARHRELSQSHDAVFGYDESNGNIQSDRLTGNGLVITLSEAAPTGLTTIGGDSGNDGDDWRTGPIVYGEAGVVAVGMAGGKLAVEDWGERLAGLGLPTSSEPTTQEV